MDWDNRSALVFCQNIRSYRLYIIIQGQRFVFQHLTHISGGPVGAFYDGNVMVLIASIVHITVTPIYSILRH